MLKGKKGTLREENSTWALYPWGINESWVQRMERDTMGPVLRRIGVQPHKPGKLRHVSYTTIAVLLHTAVIVV